MAYLLDTCTISEPTQKAPNRQVIAYLNQLSTTDAFISTVTLAEIWKGIELLRTSKKRTDLEKWFEGDLLIRFDSHALAIDVPIALQQGALAASLIQGGWTMPIVDSFIAATALVYDLTIVTRNETDFRHAGVRILNPWK